MAASDLLCQIAPGQSGTLVQSGGRWREVRCERVSDTSVLLSISREQGEGDLTISSQSYLQTIMQGGVVRVEGVLEAIDPRNLNFGLKFHPLDKPPQLINRRQAFRVAVSLRGKLKGSKDPEAENYDVEWDVALRDLSIGGTKLVVRSPAPHAGTHCALVIRLSEDDPQMLLPCRVIHSFPGRNPPPMDTLMRLAFHKISARQESTLFRYINQVQLEMLKKGLR